jgi:hypothetical protein
MPVGCSPSLTRCFESSSAPDERQTTHRESEFLSESSVYRILKAAYLIESPAYILMQAGDR